MGLDVPSVVVTIGDARPPCVEHQAVVAAIGFWVIFITTRLPVWPAGQFLPVPPSMWNATYVPRAVVYAAGAPFTWLVATDTLSSSPPMPPRLSRLSTYRLPSLPPATMRCGYLAPDMLTSTSLAPPRSVSPLSSCSQLVGA